MAWHGFGRYLHVFFVFVFFVGQVSPVCGFVSGQVKMQVCASDGSLQTIDVSGQYDVSRFIKGYSEKTKEKEGHQKYNECAFCFSQAHLTKIIPQQSDLHNQLISETHIFIGAGSIVYKSFDSVSFNPRAPPYSIS